MIIKTQIIKEMEKGVKSVMDGKTKKFKCYGVSPQMIRDYMLEINYSKVGEMETNVWQYDWWMHFVKGNKEFIASGSGWTCEFAFEPEEA